MRITDIPKHLRLFSLTKAIPPLSLPLLLQDTSAGSRFFWHDERQDILCWDSSHQIEALGETRFEDVEAQVRQLFYEAAIQSPHPELGPRCFGGFSFRDDFLPDYRWSAFSAAQFVLPHFQYCQVDGGSYLTINALMGAWHEDEDAWEVLAEAIAAKLAGLQNLTSCEQMSSKVMARDDATGPEQWQEMIARALQEMGGGVLDKVVLSRIQEIYLDEDMALEPPLSHLLHHYPDCTVFAYEASRQQVFLGASPEIIVDCNSGRLRTMALAGTKSRSDDPSEDERLGFELLSDPKERLEHQLVIDAIVEQLRRIGTDINLGETGLMKLRGLQHIYTPIECKSEHNVLQNLKSLHPTPALGGQPRREALECIKELETLPRGWYAAPVGYIDSKLDGKFAVAIRSAVVQQRRAWLFAGAGIVPQSKAEQEWQETALKFHPMQRALGVV